MALIQSYSAANRQVDEDLAVTYTKTRVYGSWSYASGTSIVTVYSVWSYTRTATKSYRYVGMTKAAANSCAEAIRQIYQRNTTVSEWGDTDEFKDVDGGSIPMADVGVRHVDGDMWEVSVNVHESDSRMRRVPVASAESLFTDEDQRDYDEN